MLKALIHIEDEFFILLAKLFSRIRVYCGIGSVANLLDQLLMKLKKYFSLKILKYFLLHAFMGVIVVGKIFESHHFRVCFKYK